MARHLLIAGHGKRRNGTFDPGATGHIAKGEHRYVKEDLFPAMRKFVPKNHNIVFFDKYNVYDHGNIVGLAKQYDADEVTEVHFDAASAAASGGHVIVYSGYSPDKMDLALRDAIDDMVGVRYNHRGHKGISGRNNLANVNRTANAGITYRLIELGFGTNARDARIMTGEVEKYAKTLVEAITGKSSSTPAKKQKSVSTNNKIEWVGTNDKGKRIEAIVPSVNYYDTQRWTNPSGTFKKGEGWIVDNLYRVNGSLQYRVQNSNGDLYYITARPDLVRIVGSGSTSIGSSSSVAKPTLRRGSRGNEVTKLQRQLNNHNPRFNPRGIDGIYGAGTEDAVLRYQKHYGVRPYDGIYGQKTANKFKKTM